MDEITYTPGRLAKKLGISKATWKRERGLPHIKIGKTLRFNKDSIIEWLEQHEIGNNSASLDT